MEEKDDLNGELDCCDGISCLWSSLGVEDGHCKETPGISDALFRFGAFGSGLGIQGAIFDDVLEVFDELIGPPLPSRFEMELSEGVACFGGSV